jgi:hypothetical protein
MTRSDSGAVMPSSSPHSFGEASHHDTPLTSLTAFSPEDIARANANRFKFSITSAHADSTTGSDDGTIS